MFSYPVSRSVRFINWPVPLIQSKTIAGQLSRRSQVHGRGRGFGDPHRHYLPAVQRGLDKSGRSLDSFEIVGPGFVVTGGDEKAIDNSATAIRQQIAFYASTPAYRPVLELHGWGDAQDELNRMSKEGAWQEMGTLINDEMLETFAVVGEPEKIAPGVLERYGSDVDRMAFYSLGSNGDSSMWDQIASDLLAG